MRCKMSILIKSKIFDLLEPAVVRSILFASLRQLNLVFETILL